MHRYLGRPGIDRQVGPKLTDDHEDGVATEGQDNDPKRGNTHLRGNVW
jgi:hypothetical protein